MPIKKVIQDDLDGSTLPDDTKPTTVKVGDKSFAVYLSDDSLSKLVTMLSGDGPLTTVETSYPAKKAKKGTGTKSSVNTYGYDFHTVRTWAIKNGQKGKAGNPITENTKVLWQGIYDAYKAAVGS